MVHYSVFMSFYLKVCYFRNEKGFILIKDPPPPFVLIIIIIIMHLYSAFSIKFMFQMRFNRISMILVDF